MSPQSYVQQSLLPSALVRRVSPKSDALAVHPGDATNGRLGGLIWGMHPCAFYTWSSVLQQSPTPSLPPTPPRNHLEMVSWDFKRQAWQGGQVEKALVIPAGCVSEDFKQAWLIVFLLTWAVL